MKGNTGDKLLSTSMAAGKHHRPSTTDNQWALDLAWDIGESVGDQTVINIRAQEAETDSKISHRHSKRRVPDTSDEELTHAGN